jgi:isopenicillin N synthase-like dioxygenase
MANVQDKFFVEDHLQVEDQIPVIDVSSISLRNVDVATGNYEALGKTLCNVLSTCGFAYLINHGIPDMAVHECVAESKKFFKLPPAVKEKYNRGVNDIHGYSWKGREVLARNGQIESKESFDIHSWRTDAKFPDNEDETPDLRSKVKCLAHQSGILARRLLHCLATDLGADPIQFLQDHSNMFNGMGNNATSIRLLHYPNIETDFDSERRNDDSKVISSFKTRCEEHTDYGGLTLLYQDSHCGGLEVQTIDGNWIAATPIPNTIVLNIGDLLSFWLEGGIGKFLIMMT